HSDVTDQRAATHALAKSEERLRLATGSAEVGIWEMDVATGNGQWSELASRVLGVERQDFTAADWIEAFHPVDRSRGMEAWRLAVEEGKPYEIELRTAASDDQQRERWILTRGTVQRDAAGRPVSAIGVLFDVSPRRRAEEALRESEAFTRRISEIAPSILYVYDLKDRRSIWANRGMTTVLGYSAEQIAAIGDRLIRELMHPDDLGPYKEHLALIATLEDGQSAEVRYRLKRPDGEWVWLHSQDMVFRRDADGRPRQIIGAAIDVTQQEAATAALRQSEERYRALFEAMEQGFCIVEVMLEGDRAVDHRFIEINPAFSRQSGLPATVLGKSIKEAVPDLEASWFERYGNVARSGAPERFIAPAAALGRWFEVYAFRIGDPEQKHVAILFTDVTERIKQEADLQLRLNAIPQMVWSTLPDGFHDFYNDRWYEFTGTPPGSTDGEGWNGMFHPEDQDRAWSRWSQSLETGEPYEIEYRLRHRDGGYRWVLGRALPVRDEDGAVVRWMGTCTDIDDRVRARKALEESEATLRAVIESMPVGLMFADASGKLTGRNNHIRDILQHDLVLTDRTEDYSRDYRAFHADGRQVESDEYPLARAIAGKEARPELECQVVRGDGSLAWVRYVAAPILNANGKLVGGVVASIDVDREKRLTASLEREVEKVIAEREAAQEALRQSQKLEAMGQLTGGVAHDFNNLLTPIIGSLDLLHRKQVGDARLQRLVDGALQSAERAKTLVQRLLAFARRQPLQPTAVDVGKVVNDMADLIASTSGPRIRVDVTVAPELPPAHADSNQLEMALLNLSVNARDAM
ncbi:MAG TPA: PAS domain-containing protein, partial [Sphingomonas sp.]|nr:PAS domain-containing protein [Sphingomonas sp.]